MLSICVNWFGDRLKKVFNVLVLSMNHVKFLGLAGIVAVLILILPSTGYSQTLEVQQRQGYAAQSSGNYTEAERIWREVLLQAPNNAEAYKNLGWALAEQDRPKEAEAALLRSIEINPNDAYAYDLLGLALNYQDRYREAEIALRQAIELNPTLSYAYNKLGWSLNGQRRHEEAEIAIRQAIELDPNDGYAHDNLGWALNAQGRFGEAESFIRRAIELIPNRAYPYHTLGWALNGLQRYVEAEPLLRRAIELDPKLVPAYNHLGYALQQQGRIDEATQEYQKSLQINPEFVPAQNNLEEALRLRYLQIHPEPNFRDEQIWLSNPDDPYSSVMRSVVRVVTPTNTGIKYGTGWIVKREGDRIWIVTNRHVVTETDFSGEESYEQMKAGQLENNIEVDFYSNPPDGASYLRLRAQVIEATGSGDDLDLALLVIDNAPKDIQPLEISQASAGLDTDVYIVGHHNDPWVISRGYINALPQGANLQFAGASIGKRSSGSPILDNQNRVIGIVTAIDPPSFGQGRDFLGGFSYGHPSSILLEKLAFWGVE